jgi:predicted metalloprotease with PDZ domain
MILGVLLFTGYTVLGQQQAKLTFTVSTEPAGPQKFHVVLYCEDLKGELRDFKMPAISPGYYRVLDFAKNVENFGAEDGRGNPLVWEKIYRDTGVFALTGIHW